MTEPYAHRCPTCSAVAGEPCRTVAGRPMTIFHRDRRSPTARAQRGRAGR